MIATWVVEFKTGYDIKDGELGRIRERIAEELACLAAEHMADVTVKQSHFIPGPMSVQAEGRLRSTTLDDPRLHEPLADDSPGRPGFSSIRLVFRTFQR